jgi:hypothetical protein
MAKKLTEAMRASERAFLEAGGKGPAASPAGALDEADSSVIDDLREWLKGKLTPEDMQRFEAVVLGAKPDEAFDEPPPFRGRPSPGGQVAALDGLPDMLRNRVFAAMSQPLRARAINAIVRQRASAEADLVKRFPAFGRIKVIP